jgi:hypothetical protein
MEYYTRYSRLIAEQYAAIGRVAVHWSLVEWALETIIVRLARAPDYLGHALANDLSVDNRLDALKRLCQVHEFQLVNQIVNPDLVEQLRSLAKEVATKKGMRNKIVHSIWFRHSDEILFGTKFRTKPALKEQEGITHFHRSFQRIDEFAADIEDLAARLMKIAELLPKRDWP